MRALTPLMFQVAIFMIGRSRAEREPGQARHALLPMGGLLPMGDSPPPCGEGLGVGVWSAATMMSTLSRASHAALGASARLVLEQMNLAAHDRSVWEPPPLTPPRKGEGNLPS